MLIRGVGMVSAIGYDVDTNVASVECGIRRWRETDVVGLDGTRLISATFLPEHLRGCARGLAMAVPALDECVAAAQATTRLTERIGLVCSVRRRWWRGHRVLPPRLTRDLQLLDRDWARLCDCVADHLRRRHGIDIPPGLRRTVRGGRTSGISAIEHAAELFRSSTVSACLVLGCDSGGEPPVLEQLDLLDDARQPGASGTRVPADGAACLFLCDRASVGYVGVAAVARARDEERADGLGSALSLALAASGHHVSTVCGLLSDRNGDRESASALLLARTRVLFVDGRDPRVLEPARSWGDLGAAAVPFLVGLANERLRRRQMPATEIVLASAGGESHAAVVLDYALSKES